MQNEVPLVKNIEKDKKLTWEHNENQSILEGWDREEWKIWTKPWRLNSARNFSLKKDHGLFGNSLSIFFVVVENVLNYICTSIK